MNLDLTDKEAAALIRELRGITDNDRYRFSERIRTLTAIVSKLDPESVSATGQPRRRGGFSRRHTVSHWGGAERLPHGCRR